MSGHRKSVERKAEHYCYLYVTRQGACEVHGCRIEKAERRVRTTFGSIAHMEVGATRGLGKYTNWAVSNFFFSFTHFFFLVFERFCALFQIDRMALVSAFIDVTLKF